jgi:PEP-CTERM motif
MRRHTKRLLLAAVAAMGIGGASSAHAYVTFFGEDINNSETVPLASTPNSAAAEAALLKDLSSAGTATFEANAQGTKAPLVLGFPGFSGSIDATLNGSGEVVRVPVGTAVAGRYSIPSESTSQFWQATALAGIVGTSSFSLAFSQPIAAFGFYGVDVGDFGGKLQVQLLSGSSVVQTLQVPNTSGDEGSTGGSVLYFGLIAEEPTEVFDGVNFLMSTGVDVPDDVFAFDNFTIADFRQVSPPSPVPEPTTLALLAGSLLALGLTRRRRA